jgi:hypothetical protein
MSDAAWDRFRAIRAARDPGRLFAGFLSADESALNTRGRDLVAAADLATADMATADRQRGA